MAYDGDGRQAGFSKGDVHDLVLVNVLGGDRHLPALAALGLDQGLSERRLLLVHEAGGEELKVFRVEEKIELRSVFRQSQQNHLQTGRKESAVLGRSRG